MSEKTYIRKTREGWKMVHKEDNGQDQGTTIVAPLSKKDAEVLRDTFKKDEKKVFTFLASRTLTVEIEIEADTLEEAQAKIEDEVQATPNSEFSDVGDETAQLIKWPDGVNVDSDTGIKVF